MSGFRSNSTRCNYYRKMCPLCPPIVPAVPANCARCAHQLRPLCPPAAPLGPAYCALCFAGWEPATSPSPSPEHASASLGRFRARQRFRRGHDPHRIAQLPAETDVASPSREMGQIGRVVAFWDPVPQLVIPYKRPVNRVRVTDKETQAVWGRGDPGMMARHCVHLGQHDMIAIRIPSHDDGRGPKADFGHWISPRPRYEHGTRHARNPRCGGAGWEPKALLVSPKACNSVIN